MTRVEVRGGNVEGAFKKFKQKVAKSGIPSEIKNRKHYEKPGIKRRKKVEEAKKNSNKKSKSSHST